MTGEVERRYHIVIGGAAGKSGIGEITGGYQTAVYLGITGAAGKTAIDVITIEVFFGIIIPVESYLLITFRGVQPGRCRRSRVGRSSIIFGGITAFVSHQIHRCHYIVISGASGKPGISEITGGYQTAVYLGVAGAAGHTAIDIVAVEVFFRIISPVESYLLITGSSCQAGRG